MKTWFVVLALILAAGAGAVYWAWDQLDRPLAFDSAELVYVVPPGATLNQVGRDLKERGVLSQPWLWTQFAKLTDQARRIQAGEYVLTPSATPRSLLEQFVAGEVRLHSITLVEGWRFDEALQAIRAHPAVTVTELTADEMMAGLGKPNVHPEGQLLPETYHFPRGTSDLALVKQAHQALTSILDEIWPRRAGGLPLDNAYEALILASIIEKETALDSERPEIAGVFVRRLNRGMRLETDPTVIYGLGDGFDGDLRTRDLVADTPYNTYRRAGLPPTPIALASAASLHAATHPAPGDALFFVATGEGDGSHYFSQTYEEHLAAIERYHARLRESR